MTPQERMALALEYQRKQSDPFDAVPVAGVKQPLTPNETTWYDRLNNLSAGLGKGIEGQLEGYKQLVTQPVQSAKDMAQAVKTIATNPSMVADALSGMAGKAASGSQGLGEVVGENLTFNPRKLAMALSKPSINEMVVYHGTPHRFPATEKNPLGEFDASKIGTGEGAQAYGHGLYVAESPAVAKEYLPKQRYDVDANGNPNYMMTPQNTYIPSKEARDSLEDAINYRESLLQNKTAPDFEEKWKSATKAIDVAQSEYDKSLNKPWGSFYHVDLPDPMIERMLDWDKPLSEQPANVQAAINSLRGEMAPIWGKNINKSTSGESLLIALASAKNDPKYASQLLRDAGVPGIKYLDAGSKAIPDPTYPQGFKISRPEHTVSGKWMVKGNDYNSKGMLFDAEAQAQAKLNEMFPDFVLPEKPKGTRNFVVFPGEESNLKILERK